MFAIFIEERHQAILAKLTVEKRISANDLTGLFNVSIDTIRRDLSMMEEKGLLKRTHGGAIPAFKVRNKSQSSFAEWEEKFPHFEALAQKAVSYISKGDTVYLDGSILQRVMLQYLPEFEFSVVTNVMPVANELRERDNIDLFFAGGRVDHRGYALDPLALDFVKHLQIDVGFISGAGLSATHGLSCTSVEVAAFNRVIVEVSRKCICLSPREKLGNRAFIRSVDAREMDLVITDQDANDEEVEKLMQAGIEVVVV
ncbi:MAG TPA: DeoR/GlpR family DNA-binding transcription regulator [Bacillota bacterium]|nr:DeoR/GlpR family DNA-binding transcription regulator [Bacillota bacterium]